MAVHTHDDVLVEVKAVLPETHDVSRVYMDDDTQWWVTNNEHDTFAYAWYDETDVLNTRPYKP